MKVILLPFQRLKRTHDCPSKKLILAENTQTSAKSLCELFLTLKYSVCDLFYFCYVSKCKSTGRCRTSECFLIKIIIHLRETMEVGQESGWGHVQAGRLGQTGFTGAELSGWRWPPQPRLSGRTQTGPKTKIKQVHEPGHTGWFQGVNVFQIIVKKVRIKFL